MKANTIQAIPGSLRRALIPGVVLCLSSLVALAGLPVGPVITDIRPMPAVDLKEAFLAATGGRR